MYGRVIKQPSMMTN